jgi:hypothetical protein
MDVVRHGYVSVQLVEALGAVVLESFEEKFRIGFGLEETTAIGGDRGNEEGTDDGGSWRFGHERSLCGGNRRRISRFRLRLHSGLRQSAGALCARFLWPDLSRALPRLGVVKIWFWFILGLSVRFCAASGRERVAFFKIIHWADFQFCL